jgi:hypothetical protein
VLSRLLFGGVAWLLALLLFAALIQWSGSRPPHITSELDGVDALSRAINQARLASRNPERMHWTVIKSAGALQEMVVYVAAEQPEHARAIAEQIIGPVHEHYVEILVYVHAIDETRNPLVRRVEWTPRGGYRETSFRD